MFSTFSFLIWKHPLEGRNYEKIYQDSSTIQYTYGTFGGNLQTVTDAKGQAKTYAYDVDDSLTNVVYTVKGSVNGNGIYN